MKGHLKRSPRGLSRWVLSLSKQNLKGDARCPCPPLPRPRYLCLFFIDAVVVARTRVGIIGVVRARVALWCGSDDVKKKGCARGRRLGSQCRGGALAFLRLELAVRQTAGRSRCVGRCDDKAVWMCRRKQSSQQARQEKKIRLRAAEHNSMSRLLLRVNMALDEVNTAWSLTSILTDKYDGLRRQLRMPPTIALDARQRGKFRGLLHRFWLFRYDGLDRQRRAPPIMAFDALW